MYKSCCLGLANIYKAAAAAAPPLCQGRAPAFTTVKDYIIINFESIPCHVSHYLINASLLRKHSQNSIKFPNTYSTILPHSLGKTK